MALLFQDITNLSCAIHSNSIPLLLHSSSTFALSLVWNTSSHERPILAEIFRTYLTPFVKNFSLVAELRYRATNLLSAIGVSPCRLAGWIQQKTIFPGLLSAYEFSLCMLMD